MSLTITPLSDAAGKLVGVAEIARDVTEQDQAERAVSSLSSRLIHAQEEERARIARELHDDIGQRLALLAIGLTDRSRTAPGLLHESEATRLKDQAVEIAADIQALAHELHSSKLEVLGVAMAMGSFCHEFSHQKHVEIDFAVLHVPDQVSSDISLCLFRVLQEALHNAAKHSGVQHFEVRLTGADGQIHLLVSDAGKGFDLEAARAGRGLGLVSMGERLTLVGGDVAIDTQPGRGTRIHARAPVRTGSSLA